MARQDEELEVGVEQDQGVGVEDLYYGVMAVARVLGFHVTENKNGTYIVRCRRLLPGVLLSLGYTIYAVLLVVYLTLEPIPFWFVVTNLSCGFAYCFIVVAYVETVLNRDDMTRYMTLMRSFKIRQSRWKTNMSLLLYLCYTLVLSACTLLKLPSVQVAANIPLVCITSFVPAILDLYTESFVVVLTASLEKLSKEVHARHTWADGGVRDTFTSWMEVVKAITMHNKVFSLCAGLRVIQLMMKAMSFMYVLCSLQRLKGGCLSLLVITAVPLLETAGLLYRICSVGQHLTTASDRLLKAVTTAAYQVSAGSKEQLALTHLASRMEHHLPSLLAWGLGSLTLETFIQVSRVVTACLVMVVQLGQDDPLDYVNIEGALTRFDHCFASNITTYRDIIANTNFTTISP